MMTTTKKFQGVQHALVDHATSQPDRLFLLANDGVTYQQAHNWVMNVATEHLVDMTGERVMIWMDKGNNFALAILAALQANCIYVPVDGNQPASRATKIVENAMPSVVILDQTHYHELRLVGIPESIRLILLLQEAGHNVVDNQDLKVVSLSNEILYSQHTEPSSIQAISEDQIAAILYTSGSTGQPKGVQFSHRNIANFVRWSCGELNLTKNDVFLNIASFNFDLSTFDLFASLQAGASLYVTHERELQSISKLAEILAAYKITVLYTVPSLLALMSRAQAWQHVESIQLKRLIFAGEVMPTAQLKILVQQIPSGCELYNFYGPTETNVCLYHKVNEQDISGDMPIPIGRPIAGAEMWLLDEDGCVVPPESDAVGEIWVAGNCVTPGYWQLIHPRNSHNHKRGCHATGDLACYKNGELSYHGRVDRMLKINGYRVELGEIESVLSRHPDIQEVAVIVRKMNESKRIIAYLTPRVANQNIPIEDIKAFCAHQLPKYMIPHKVEQIESVPKNRNGKTDYIVLNALEEQSI